MAQRWVGQHAHSRDRARSLRMGIQFSKQQEPPSGRRKVRGNRLPLGVKGLGEQVASSRYLLCGDEGPCSFLLNKIDFERRHKRHTRSTPPLCPP